VGHEGTLSSAVHGGVIFASICFSVEVSDLSTVGEILTDVIQCVRLNTSGERSHLREFLSGVPDDTLDETLATSDRVEVNLEGRGLELHGCLVITL